MNKLIILGNGFDLAHGMPTKYTDFIDWLFQEELKSFISEIKLDSNWYKDKVSSHNSKLFSFRLTSRHELRFIRDAVGPFLIELEEVENNYVGHLIGNQGTKGPFKFEIFYISTLFRKIMDSLTSKYHWVDIERLYYDELKKISINNANYTVEKLNNELGIIKELLVTYLMQIENSQKIKVSDFFIFSDNYIKEIDYESKNNEYQCLLNFNYTKTYKPYIRGLISKRFEEVIDIHGSLDENNIVVGYGDEIDENYKMLENFNDKRFLENVKSVEYLQNIGYTRLLNFIEDDIFYVYIMGHSCGLSDRTLLNTIFEHKNCIKIKLFYHQFKDEKGEVVGDNFKELSINISRHFNDKKELRKKVLSKDRCVPLPQWDD